MTLRQYSEMIGWVPQFVLCGDSWGRDFRLRSGRRMDDVVIEPSSPKPDDPEGDITCVVVVKRLSGAYVTGEELVLAR